MLNGEINIAAILLNIIKLYLIQSFVIHLLNMQHFPFVICSNISPTYKTTLTTFTIMFYFCAGLLLFILLETYSLLPSYTLIYTDGQADKCLRVKDRRVAIETPPGCCLL